MTRPLVSDELWAAVAPLLSEEPPKPKGGRPRCDDRRALEGIVFVLWSGIGWERLPREVFGCTGMTPDRGPGQAVLAQAVGLARRRGAG